MNLTHSHDWVAQRLLAYGAGLLAEAETLDVEQHLRSCPECRARLASIRPPAGSDPGHLPASLVATWPRSSRLLQGTVRELVVRHLHQCESCRASLVFAGHEPVLAPLRHGAEPRRARAGGARAAWIWAFGLTGAVAGAAAWLLTLQPSLLERGADWPVLGAIGLSHLERTAAVTVETAVDSLAPGALRLPQPGFGDAGGDVLDVGAVTSVSGLVLVLPPALQPPTPDDGARTMTVTLLREGRELVTHRGRFYALGDAIRLRPEGRLEGGDYDLRFALAPATPEGRPLIWFYRLRVR